MFEDPDAIEVQAIINGAEDESENFSPENALEYMVRAMESMSDNPDLDAIIQQVGPIISESPQWRHLMQELQRLHHLQTHHPGIFRLLHPGNLIAYVDYAIVKWKLAIIFGSSPQHIKTFNKLHSREAALGYIDAIMSCNMALRSIRELLAKNAREVFEGLPAQVIDDRNRRDNLQLVP